MLKKNGHRTGRLRYLKSEDYNSFCYSQFGFSITQNRYLRLSKIGKIRIKFHRCINNDSIKQIIVKRQGKKWFAIICRKIMESVFSFINPIKSIGIDVGITKFAHDSDNHVVKNPLFLKKMLKPLRKASRILSRMYTGSSNREKAKSRLQVLHERIRNQRKDFLHKLSTKYSRKYDLIFLERLMQYEDFKWITN